MSDTKRPVVIPGPVPCEVGVRRVTSNVADECIVIDLTYERDGKRHRVQARLTMEQFALAVTGKGGVMGTVTAFSTEPR